ncbi:TPA: hypothetical protein DEP96_04140 [Candidatus Uhrbacteria bacterium]|nr:hypothetical protein [Candidatus Uhrbacteria bacterium]
MLHKNDMAAIRALMIEVLESTVHALRLDIRDEIYSANKALENSLRRDIKADIQQLRIEMRVMRTEIVSDIGDILDGAILPQIAELQHDVAQLKVRVGV